MVHFNATQATPDVTNHPHQHVFMICGEETLFGVHMTQYHCEVHKYQLILRFTIPDDAKRELLKLKKQYPNDTFLLGNEKEGMLPGVKEMTVPDLASGETAAFTGNIFQGLRYPREGEVFDHDTYPWDASRCRPAIKQIKVEVERVVLFRPFSHQELRPIHPTFWLWGDNGEAHMTNLQTGELASSPFEAASYGPDTDICLSLREAPAWLDPKLLKAGVVVSVPDIDMYDTDTWSAGPAFDPDTPLTVLYRGVGPARTVIPGPTFMWGTSVACSPDADPHDGQSLYMSTMPPAYHEPPDSQD